MRVRVTNYTIYGITGSGKTYIYALLCQYWLKKEYQVLWMVRNWYYTTATRSLGIFSSTEVVSYHWMSEREEDLAWLDIVSAKAKIVIGTRSSVFLPMPNLA